MNFYQSKIRKYINQEIYKKPIFEIEIFWKKYWWIRKDHKKLWISFSWFQVLWIKLPEKISGNDLMKELKNIKKQFKSSKNIFFQFGFINELSQPYYENRKKIQKHLEKFNLKPSLKENMPLATVIIDLTLPEEEIYKKFSKSAKRHINKAIKNNLIFTTASKNDIDDFYDLWNLTAKSKWFNIYSKDTYLQLIEFLRKNNCWNLYLVKKNNTIVAWSIEVNFDNYSYYLYGASNKNTLKVWWHYFLKWELFKFLKRKWIKKVDLLWVSPLWFENHHLKWVSQFKHSFWGKHIEYWGNYDLPLNLLYWLVKILKR